MNPRTTAILFLLAAGLGAFVYFYEIRGAPERAEAEEAGKRLFPGFEAEEVSEIALTTSDGREARARREDGGWRLVEPLDFPGDAFALDGMASALADLKRVAVFAEPQPPEVYGLDDAEVVRFVADGASHELRLGGEAPMGSNSYAAVGGDDAVYTVSTWSLNALRKSLDDLREKRIVRFDRSAVDTIRASWPGGGVELRRGEEGWRLAAPIEERADPATVDALLSDLSFLRAEGFEDEPPPDAEAGLAPPAFEVELRGAGGEDAEPVAVSLAIGADTGAETRLVRAGQPSLFRVPEDWLADIPRELVAYRFKELASFAPTDAVRLEIRFQPRMSTAAGDAPVSLTATRGEAGWSAEPEAFAPGKLAGLVSALSSLTAVDILADEMGPAELDALGLEPPLAEFAVYGEEEDEPLAVVKLGRSRGEEGIAAQRPGDPRVFALDAALAERVPISLTAFRNRFAAPEEPETPPEEAPPPSEAAAPELPGPAAESP